MSDDVVVKVENLTKTYRLYSSNLDRLKESLHPLRRKYHHDFYALEDVSFELKKGESVGIVGKNGSGKSTLLKIITGVLTPTSGSVRVNGKISALLELGAGFNPELTGLENIYFNGSLMGYSKGEVDSRLGDVLSFADIGEFVYQPVKTYSSGMFVRLAFALAVNVEPDILIIDEALSVGDSAFQEKCFNKINEIKKNATLIFVSHDMGVVQTLCDRAIVIDRGHKCIDATPYEATLTYFKLLKNINENISSGLIASDDKSVKLNWFKFLDHNMNITTDLESGKPFNVEIEIEFNNDIDNLAIGILFRNLYGMKLFGIHSYHQMQYDFGHIRKNTKLNIMLNSLMPLCPGNYVVSLGITKQDSQESYEHLLFIERWSEIGVYGSRSVYGIFDNRTSNVVYANYVE